MVHPEKKGNCNALIPKSDPNYRSKYAKSYIREASFIENSHHSISVYTYVKVSSIWGRVVFTLPKQNKKYAP